jgi:tetratricopeptide (TPR) repeat protein
MAIRARVGRRALWLQADMRDRLKFVLISASIVLSLVGAIDRVTAQNAAGNSLLGKQNPEQLQKAALDYEKFLRYPPAGATHDSINQVQARLATVYFLLHRYDDSLAELRKIQLSEPAPHKTEPGTSTDPAAPSLQAQIYLVSGLDYLELNQVPNAVSNLHRALELQPTNATARLAYGDALARSNRMEDALKEYQQQIQLTPQLSEAWYKAGLAHSFIASALAESANPQSQSIVLRQYQAEQLSAQGRYLDAGRELFKLLHEAPQQPGLHADLGRALLEVGYPKTAEEQLKKEIAIDPANPLARMELAQTAALRGDWQEVTAQMTTVSSAHPQELTRLLQMAPAGLVQQAWAQGKMQLPADFTNTSVGAIWRVWMEQSQVVSVKKNDANGTVLTCSKFSNAASVPGMWLSESCYEDFIAKHTGKSASLPQKIKLAEAYFRLGQYDHALQAGKAILDSDQDNEWGLYWIRNAHRGLAQQCLLKVADLDPNSARAHQMLAQDYAGWVQYANAKKEYQIAIALAPNQSDLHLGLGTVCWQTDDWAEAEKELKLALELTPESALARYELGDTYIHESEWEPALEQLEKVPRDSSVAYRSALDLARAEDQLGKTQDAIQTLLAVSSHDEDGQAHYLLASLYRKTGDAAHAKEALETFKQLRANTLQSSEAEAAILEEEQANKTN